MVAVMSNKSTTACFRYETNDSYEQQDLPSCIGGHGTVA